MNENQITTDAELLRITEGMESLKAQATDLTVNSDESKEIAISVMVDIKKSLKTLEGKRVDYKADFLKKCQEIDTFAKKFSIPLKEIFEIANQKVLSYHEELERIQKEEARKAQEKFEREQLAKRKKEEELQAKLDAEEDERKKLLIQQKIEKNEEKEIALPMVDTEVETKTETEKGKLNIKKVWTFKVTDPSKVPADYLMVDEKKIKAAVKLGIHNIDGVLIYEEKKTDLRTSK